MEPKKMTGPTMADISQISTEEISQFLTEKVKQSSCPVCDETQWSIIHDNKDLLCFTGMPADGSYNLPPKAIPIAASICVNCGFMRLHLLGIILQWKLNKITANGI